MSEKPTDPAQAATADVITSGIVKGVVRLVFRVTFLLILTGLGLAAAGVIYLRATDDNAMDRFQNVADPKRR